MTALPPLKPLRLVTPDDLPTEHQDWLAVQGFTGKDGQFCLLPDGSALLGCEAISRWCLSVAADRLKAGEYKLEDSFTAEEANRLALGWALGAERYKPRKQPGPALIWPKSANRGWVEAASEATLLGRRLISLPTNLLGPAQLQSEVEALGARHHAAVSSVIGNELLSQHYPAIHAVGRAAAPDRARRA